ncbi:hypothetical protein 44RRORF240c [Aeromonas phage 44RR2.8t]|uniref:Uncharacterized protein n=2 Tax=Biquartavirus 44RR2 TaxID=115987 RepID=Q6U962_9CAUD|nr:hypothetical protein ST44RRORF240c [Aeromonas phage 44RR2.8t]AAQ81558.1 hypothetical protein 44RRORF240c [Aeromonas phage 44RR2.8t]APU00712.1 hypothetical protein [Aeromonas phage 44RR2.8t.2]
MATIKLAPAPCFAINRYGEVVDNNHCGPRHLIECKCRMMDVPAGEAAPSLLSVVNTIALTEDVENVYILAVIAGFNSIKVRYGTHPDF